MMRDFLYSSFDYESGLFIQRENSIDRKFEKQYLLLREKENRIYTNETLRQLPFVQNNHPLKKEWAIRKESCKRLTNHLKTNKNINRLLEVGCGNGWLSNQLAKLYFEVCGIDVNEAELLQGAKVFNLHPKPAFLFADIFTAPFPKLFFDSIILPGSIQYFSNLPALINRLLEILTEKGEIHIIDSPIYRASEVAAAKQRTSTYYSHMGFPEMSQYYFHHTWDELAPYKTELLHDPASMVSKIKMILRIPSSPFPWIKISRR